MVPSVGVTVDIVVSVGVVGYVLDGVLAVVVSTVVTVDLVVPSVGVIVEIVVPSVGVTVDIVVISDGVTVDIVVSVGVVG